MPYTVGNLSSLIDFRVSHNKLTGNIPPTMGKLLTLRQLLLDNNQVAAQKHTIAAAGCGASGGREAGGCAIKVPRASA